MLTGDALPDDIRTLLEERFWRPIERSATIEALRESGAGIDDAAHDPFLFADHGVVHVRDIARGVISLAESANGLLLPLRPPERQRAGRRVRAGPSGPRVWRVAVEKHADARSDPS